MKSLNIYRQDRGLALSSSKGFTLIEILVVFGIFALIISLGLIVSMDSFRSFAFRNEQNLAISVLQKARSQAMSNVCIGQVTSNPAQCSLPGYCCDGKSHGVYFDSNQYVIFQGAAFNAGDPANQNISKNNDDVKITDLSGYPPSDIIFNQLEGTVAANWAIKISASGHPPAQITINREGQIDTP